MFLFKFATIVTSLFVIQSVNGLYEDQTGAYDWRQQYIGKPIYSHLDPNENRVYVATEQHVLSALNRKNGNIIWRKVLENNENGEINFILWSKSEVVIVTGNGRYARAFNYKHGYLTWEFNLFKNNSQNMNYYGFGSKIESEAYYLTNGYEICYLNAKEKTCSDLSTESGYVFNSNLIETDYGIFAIGIKDESILKIQFASVLNTILSQSTIETLWIKSNTQCFTIDNQYFCIDNDKMQISDVKVSDLAFQTYSFSTKLDQNSKFVHGTPSNLLFQNADGDLSLFKINKNSMTVDLLRSIYENVINYYITNHNDEKLISVVKLSDGKLNINTYSFQSGIERKDLFVNTNLNSDKMITYINGAIFEIRGGQTVLNHLCLFEDHSLVLFSHNGNKLFTREESLSNIVSVEMVDFPLIHLQEEFEDEFGSVETNLIMMFLKRIKSQIFQLKETIEDLLSKIPNKKVEITKTSNNDKIETLLKRDEFNLNKLIVVVTTIGKIFGIHSSNGQIIWDFYLKNQKPFEFSNNKVGYPFYIQRTAAHFPYEAQAAIVSKSIAHDDIENGIKTRVTVFNPLTGKLSDEYPNGVGFNFDLKQAFLANIIDNHFLKPVIFFDTENKVHVFPKVSEDFFIKSAKAFVVYIANKNSLSGYELKSIDTPSLQLWNVNLEDETIINIVAKLPHDRTHSHGKVLGDRSVLYKYLNPNMIAVVTEGLDSQKVPFVNLYLIDTINGNIITSFNHKRAKGPVHIVHSENWFFYSYHNLKYRRHEVTSIELFEGATQYNSTHFSSFDAVKPVVFSKSFIVQKSFDAMQLTITEKGIPSKDIIVACPFGTIIEIPWFLIDPRRPLELTDVDREENLLPYMPEIPLNYEFSLNYYNYVYNIRGIMTSPSGLESTSLVFVYGLDIFFTRVFPSKTFDMLREDFDYFFIITLMLGLVLGAIISKKLANSSNLKKAWK